MSDIDEAEKTANSMGRVWAGERITFATLEHLVAKMERSRAIRFMTIQSTVATNVQSLPTRLRLYDRRQERVTRTIVERISGFGARACR
jgi:hypothetical protein